MKMNQWCQFHFPSFQFSVTKEEREVSVPWSEIHSESERQLNNWRCPLPHSCKILLSLVGKLFLALNKYFKSHRIWQLDIFMLLRKYTHDLVW